MKYCLIDVTSETVADTSVVQSKKNLKSVSRNQVKINTTSNCTDIKYCCCLLGEFSAGQSEIQSRRKGEQDFFDRRIEIFV